MPRLSVRRALLYVGFAASCALFFVNFQTRDLVPAWSVALAGRNGSSGRAAELDPPADRHRHRHVASVPTTPAATARPTSTRSRDWFFRGGRARPTPAADARRPASLPLWPDEAADDRIVSQLRFSVPPPAGPLKKILLYEGFGARLRTGREEFLRSGCPVSACELTTSRSQLESADAVLFKDRFNGPRVRRNPGQLWIMYLLECPLHTVTFKSEAKFNWTATYRHDSDIVAPYEKWVYYQPDVRFRPQPINYAANKTRKVAWFVSNCGASNKRLQYAKALAKYIDVDIYGSCGTKKCPRSMARRCFEKLNGDYKFYLAFENSNCRDYITEKFFVNGLQYNVLPVVMGAHPDDYRRAAPEHSYIHVDDFKSPAELADFLHTLDRDDHLYNSYFKWKGTGEFINTFFFCRLCAMLHDERRQRTVDDLNKWWRAPGTCVTGKWPGTERT